MFLEKVYLFTIPTESAYYVSSENNQIWIFQIQNCDKISIIEIVAMILFPIMHISKLRNLKHVACELKNRLRVSERSQQQRCHNH